MKDSIIRTLSRHTRTPDDVWHRLFHPHRAVENCSGWESSHTGVYTSCLTVIDYPPEVQKRLRTSNFMESINRRLKRRTNVISVFSSEDSLLRIVKAKAMNLSDEWEGITGQATISPENLRQKAEMLKAASSLPK